MLLGPVETNQANGSCKPNVETHGPPSLPPPTGVTATAIKNVMGNNLHQTGNRLPRFHSSKQGIVATVSPIAIMKNRSGYMGSVLNGQGLALRTTGSRM